MTEELTTAQQNELELAAKEQALGEAALADLGEADLTLPMLKLTAGLTRSVIAGKHSPGVYVNSLTGADYGKTPELVVVYSFKGRFYSDRESGQSYSAAAVATAPNFWPDKYAGQRFDELPDAEETYRERVNAEEIDWGKGPPIRTTFNYVGFLTADPEIPVRLSLMRTSKKASDKLQAILRWALKAPWHSVIELGVDQKSDAQDNPYFVTTVEQGRETSPEERAKAVQLHQNIAAAKDRLNLHGDEDEAAAASAEKRAASADSDGLAVA